MRRIADFAAVFGLFAFLLAGVVPAPAWADWQTVYNINLTTGAGTNWAFVDSAGNPWAVNNDQSANGSGDTNLFRYTGSQWSLESRFTTRSQRGDYRFSYLGLNASNEPRVVYLQKDSGTCTGCRQVYFQKKTGGSWSSEAAATPANYYLGLGAYYRQNDDTFRIVYFQRGAAASTSAGLYYSTQTAGTYAWSTNPILIDNNGGSFTGLGTNTGNFIAPQAAIYEDTTTPKVHIAYWDAGDGSAGGGCSNCNIRYTLRNDDGSQDLAPETAVSKIMNQGVYQRALAIAASPTDGNAPYIAFSSGTTSPYSLGFASRTSGGTWKVSFATAAAVFSPHIGMSLDPAGHPMIGFMGYPGGGSNNARHALAHYNGCRWAVYRATYAADNANSDDNDDSGMTVSTTGRVHIFGELGGPLIGTYALWVDTAGPAAVGNLDGTFSGNDITLTWTSPAEVDGDLTAKPLPGGSLYRIQWTQSLAEASGSTFWKAQGGTNYIDLSTSCISAGTAQNHTFAAPNGAGTYYFRLFTRDEFPNNFSALSNGTTVAMDTTPPGRITTLAGAASALGAAVELSWNAPGNDGASGALGEGSQFLIGYTTSFADATSGTAWSTTSAQVAISTTGVNPDDPQGYTVFNLIPMGDTFYFRIWTKDPAGNYGALSNGATQASTTDGTAPSTNSDLAAAGVSVSTVKLTWNSAGDDGGSGNLQSNSKYAIQYTTSAADSQSSTFWSTASAQVSISTYGPSPGSLQGRTLTGLLPASTYYVRLWTKDETPVNWSGRSNMVTTSTWTNDPLTAASTFSAVSATGFMVSWDRNSNPFGTRYTVQVSSASDFNTGATDQVAFTTAPTAGPAATFTALNAYTTYYFRVRAAHNDGHFTDYVNLGSTRTLAVFYTTPVHACKGTFTSGSGALSVPVPTCYADNDVFLLFVESANETIVTPSGWTELSNSPTYTGTAASAGGVRLGVFYKVVSGAQSDVSVADSGNHTTAIIAAFRGVDTANPIHVTSGSVDASATSSLSAPSLITTSANTVIVNAIGLDKDLGDTDTLSSWANANLVGLTEVHDQTVNTNAGGGIAYSTGVKTQPGATGNTTATGDTAEKHAYLTIALKSSPSARTLAQSAYRFFANTDTTDVGSALAGQDGAASLGSAGAAFRLRMLVHANDREIYTNGQDFKLQYVGKGTGSCDAPSGGTPVSYTNVDATTLIAFKNNTPADGASLTANAGDPVHGAHSTAKQTYEEVNNATNSVSAVPADQDGLWDFALVDNSAPAGTTYCLRLSSGNGSALDSYVSYPEVTTFVSGPFCGTTKVVKQAGGGDCTKISDCVSLIPTTLTGNFCIDIQDTATYTEQIWVGTTAITTNDYQIQIGPISPGGALPVVNPPAQSTAAFRIVMSSVVLVDMTIAPTNAVEYGILSTGAYVTISGVNVDSGGKIWGAGISISSYSEVSDSNVTAQNAHGLRLTGSAGAVSNCNVSGALTGLHIATQAAGTTLSISSLTFSSLSAGATAINFADGVFISTFSDIYFADSTIAVNVNGRPLSAGAAVTMVLSSGVRAGPAHENDPGQYVRWVGWLAANAVTSVSTFSVTATWGLQDGATGYTLVASTNSSNPPSPIWASTAVAGGSTSVGTVSYPDLAPNTTYFLFVKGIGFEGYAAYPATSTLAKPAAGAQIYAVYPTSTTVNWKPLPTAASQGSSNTCEGYILQAATAPADGSASDFTGTILSSITLTGVQPSTLTISGLAPGSTYTFRVGTLNWQNVANFQVVGSTMSLGSSFVWTGNGGNTNWYNAANWSPNGTPGITNPVTIDKDVSVVVTLSSPAINFLDLTLGDSAGSFKANLDLSTTVAVGRNVTIYQNSGLTQNTSGYALSLSGDLTMLSGSSMTHRKNTLTNNTRINLSVGGTFDLQAGATIAAANLGFDGGAAKTDGSGPGGGTGGLQNGGGGGGGGHGGVGGNGAGPRAGGPANDSVTNPALPGSGGGGSGSASGVAGGAGGGLVVITASRMTINGRIIVQGAAGTTADWGAGGGAGGGVSLSASYFEGAGVILSSGGAGGGTSGSTGGGGGGGGGRISVNVTQAGTVCDLTMDASGGAFGVGVTNGTVGNPGTISSTSTLQAPTGFAGANPSSGTIYWSWNLSPQTPNYRIFSATGALGASPMSAPLGPSASFYTTVDLLPNTTATFYVGAIACAGQAEYSDEFPLSTLARVVTSTQIYQVNKTSVTLNWAAFPTILQDVSSMTAEGYVLDASSTDFSGGVVYSSRTTNVSLSTLTVKNLDSGTTYYFRVGSINWGGAVNYVLVSSAVTQTDTLPPGDETPPGPVTTLYASTVTASTSTLVLTWNVTGDDSYSNALVSGSSFTIQYATYTNVTWSTASAQVNFATSGVNAGALQTYVLPGLLANTTYFMRIWTTDEAVNVSTGLSNGTTAATLALPPDTLSTAFLNLYVTSATVAWAALPDTAVSSKTSEGYVLEASSTDFGALGLGGTTHSTSTPNVLLSTLTVFNPAIDKVERETLGVEEEGAHKGTKLAMVEMSMR
ncbi:MAG: fibronectin type III domain-containing protein [Elusimicrobia bacterium]|nr:fibronectin type III domain-containing protein [Elusimicrobiota bacterium]